MVSPSSWPKWRRPTPRPCWNGCCQLATQYGVEVIVTDDLTSYPVVAHELDIKRQVCRFHALRWMMLALKEYETLLGENWQDTIDEVPAEHKQFADKRRSKLPLFWKRILPPSGSRTPKGDAVANSAYWS